MLRNLLVGLGNGGDRSAIPVLEQALGDRHPLVRGHAAWALGELAGEESRRLLEDRLQVEEDGWVRSELEAALVRLS